MTKLYDLQEISPLITDLKTVLKRVKVHVYIDELDKGWDNSEDARYFVAGLIQASQKMNLLHPNFKVYVSIRQELFENIPQVYDDAQKIREEIQVVRWTEEELLDFISRRIAYAFPELQGVYPETLWNTLFAEVLDYRKARSFNYIIDRTQLRPRELLQFCKACVTATPASKALIDYENISRAEIEYSENKTKDLAAEYRFQYPGLLDLFTLFRGMKYNLDREEIDPFLLEFTVGQHPVGQAKWVLDYDPEDIKKALWRIGFLKAWVVGGLKAGRKAGSSYLGHYELPYLTLESINRFQIHQAFRAFLALKEK